MSRCGREEPYRQPSTDLSRNIAAGRKRASAFGAVMPRRIACPCRSRRSIAVRTRPVCPTHSKTWSAPVGRMPRTPSVEVRKWLAPNCRATASLAGFVSTATIVSAPADPRALEDVEPDPAGADDDDRLAPPDLRPVQDGPDAGEDAAAHQGGRGQRDVPRDLHRLDRLHDGPLGEGRVRSELVERPSAPRERLSWHADGLPAHGGPPAVAVRAGSAVGEGRQGHVVTRDHVGDSRADRLDDARALVSEDHGRGKGMVPSTTDRSLWHSPAAAIPTSTSPVRGPAPPGRRRPGPASRRTPRPS